MNVYNQQVLRKLQLKELDILKDFDALCQKYDMSYFVFYGSAIGALRHDGFIPWDDDIDVVMLREDFEKFVCVAKKEYTERYSLMTPEENIHYPLMNAHWGLKGTSAVGEEMKNLPYEDHISIDIFPLDNISNNKAERRRQYIMAQAWKKLMVLRQIPFPAIPYKGLKRKIMHFMCAVAHLGMRMLHISPKWLYCKCRETCVRYNGQETERSTFLTGTTPPWVYNFTREELFPPRYLNFEGVAFPFPNQLERLLTRVYGDYMQLPPVEKRISHAHYLLDFGDGEVYVNNER